MSGYSSADARQDASVSLGVGLVSAFVSLSAFVVGLGGVVIGHLSRADSAIALGALAMGCAISMLLFCCVVITSALLYREAND